MAHKKSAECNIPEDRDGNEWQSAQDHLLATRRIELAKEMMEFAKVAMANVQAMAQPDQDIDPSRY